ncbi:hypothetical protein ACFE04_009779 [Oxalis oulophora]
MEMTTTRCSLGHQFPCFSRSPKTNDWEHRHKIPCNIVINYSKNSRLSSVATKRRSQMLWRAVSTLASLEESSSSPAQDYSSDDESSSNSSPAEILAQPLCSDNLKQLLADSERAKLFKKLSEANQQNRYFKRQMHAKEDELVNFKTELAILEQEIEALVGLTEEIIYTGIPEGSRKINGKYIQSHLLSRLKAVHEKLKENINDVTAAQPKTVSLFWIGMAESVQVKGSFDGWNEGEHLSPEYDGSLTKFSTTLTLRPGRYEIKFLVDGEWLLSAEYPTVGEGLVENNLLIVE